MNKYLFKAKTKDNKIIKGYLNASSKEKLRQELLANGLYPLSLFKDYQIFKTHKIKDSVLLNFIQEWYALEKSNINSQEALNVIKNKENNKLMRSVLNIITIKLNEGYNIFECFASVKEFFPEIFIEMLNIGFMKSNMLSCLELLKDYYIDKNKNANKIKNALVYPKILFVALFLALIVVSKFIVPQFKSLYRELKTTLNGFSNFVFKILTFIGDNLFTIIVFTIGSVILFMLFKRTELYKKIFDKIKLKIPVYKHLERTNNIYLFLKSINILWKNNFNKLDSIDVISRLLPNYYYQVEFLKIKEDVEKGMLFGKSISLRKLFDQNVCDILSIGEEMNVLDENIENACVWYSFELSSKTEKFIKIIEPLSIFVMALFVLMLILVIFIPMMNSIKLVM